MKKDKISILFHKLVCRETITYVVAGILTTVVNLAVSYIFNNIIPIDANVNTAVAFVADVAFAYVINNFWVFQSRFTTWKDEFIKIGKFVGARIATLVIEEISIFVFNKQLGFNFWLVKLPTTLIFVVVLNYIFSKLFIFIKKDSKN